MSNIPLHQLLGRSYHLNNNLLPFEQWEFKNRFNPGFTRPRGKRYLNAIKKPSSDSFKRWKRNLNGFSGAVNKAKDAMLAFSKTACKMNFGYIIHDEVDDFPNLPGEINDLKHFQTGRVTDVTLTAIPSRVGKNSHIEDMIKQHFYANNINAMYGAMGTNKTAVESQIDNSVTPEQLRQYHRAFINDPWIKAIRNVQLEAYQNSNSIPMTIDAEAFGLSDYVVNRNIFVNHDIDVIKSFDSHDFVVKREDLINNDFAPDMTIRIKPHRFDIMTTDDIIRDMESSREALNLMYPTKVIGDDNDDDTQESEAI